MIIVGSLWWFCMVVVGSSDSVFSGMSCTFWASYDTKSLLINLNSDFFLTSSPWQGL